MRFLVKSRRWWAAGGLLVLGIIGGFVIGTQASHNFSDVATGAFYHNAVEWIVNRSITAGCAVGLYCPDANVTRAQMAQFMYKLGLALTPSYLDIFQFPGPLDLDANPVVCQTSDYMVTGFPRTASVDGVVRITAGGALAFLLQSVYSTDGGTTWSSMSFVAPAESASAPGDVRTANVHGLTSMDVGTTYRFGMELLRFLGTGTADAVASGCETHVMILNRNGATTPLRP